MGSIVNSNTRAVLTGLRLVAPSLMLFGLCWRPGASGAEAIQQAIPRPPPAGTAVIQVETIPSWVIPTMAFIESSSYRGADGRWVWVNKARGHRGTRRGMFQMGRLAFRDIARPGETWAMLDNPDFAEECCRRWLWMWRIPGESWEATAQHWFAGPGDLSAYYLKRIQEERRVR